MSIEIKNGSLVHKLWEDLSDPELIGHFQYFGDAKRFAESQEAMTDTTIRYTITDTYTGKMQIVLRQASKKASS